MGTLRGAGANKALWERCWTHWRTASRACVVSHWFAAVVLRAWLEQLAPVVPMLFGTRTIARSADLKGGGTDAACQPARQDHFQTLFSPTEDKMLVSTTLVLLVEHVASPAAAWHNL